MSRSLRNKTGAAKRRREAAEAEAARLRAERTWVAPSGLTVIDVTPNDAEYVELEISGGTCAAWVRVASGIVWWLVARPGSDEPPNLLEQEMPAYRQAATEWAKAHGKLGASTGTDDTVELDGTSLAG